MRNRLTLDFGHGHKETVFSSVPNMGGQTCIDLLAENTYDIGHLKLDIEKRGRKITARIIDDEGDAIAMKSSEQLASIRKFVKRNVMLYIEKTERELRSHVAYDDTESSYCNELGEYADDALTQELKEEIHSFFHLNRKVRHLIERTSAKHNADICISTKLFSNLTA